MNDRIEIRDTKCVWIAGHAASNARTRVAIEPAGILVNEVDYDAEGLDALIDCLQCYRKTKSFAALKEEQDGA